MKKITAIVFVMLLAININAQVLDQQTVRTNLSEVLRMVDAFDVMAAVEYLNSRGEPGDVARQYSQIVKDLYWKNRISELAAIGRCGIQYCYIQASAAKNPVDKEYFMAYAKTIAYDVAANTWPAWGDKGITMTDTDRLAGLDCAKTNLRLALYLNRDDFHLGNAQWILGAHYMVDRKFTHAILAFMKARAHFKNSGNTEFILMAEGYIAITEFVKRPSQAGGNKIMDVVIKLKGLETEDADFFAVQLETVLKYMTAEK